MKKVFFLLAVAGMFSFAACNNTEAPVEEQPAVEEMVETPAEEMTENAVETPAEETQEAQETVVAE